MEKNIDQKIKSVVDKNCDNQIKFLQSLVRTKSANYFTNDNSFSNEPVEFEVAKLIKKKLEKIGLKPKFKGISSERPNVICEIKGKKKNGKTLIFNGHMDTVVPDNNYGCDPYGGEIKNGKLFGVGSVDMKASLAIFVFVARALKDLKLKLKGNLIFTFVVDEEPGACSEYGTKYLLKSGLKGDAAIVAEPLDKKICIGHRGICRFKLTTFGESIHTGSLFWEKGKKGKNAIIEMMKVIRLLQKFEVPFNRSLIFENRKPVFTFPTVISGGKSINAIPSECSAYGDVRLLPGNSLEQVRKLIIGRLDKADVRYKLKNLLFVPAVEISKKEEIVQILSKNSKYVLGRAPEISGSGAGNDGWMFIKRGIPTICGFGPDGENIHSKKEFAYLKSVKQVTEIYLRTIVDFLGVES